MKLQRNKMQRSGISAQLNFQVALYYAPTTGASSKSQSEQYLRRLLDSQLAFECLNFQVAFTHYSGLNLNQDKAASRRQYTRYGKASQRCTGLNLIHYSILLTFAPHAGAGHFLFFASPKKRKQKKGDCGHRFGFAKLPSLHAVFRAGSQLAAAPLRTCKPLFPEKPRSVRLRQQTGGKLA